MQTGGKWNGWEVAAVIGRGSFGAVYEIHRDVFGTVEKAALKQITIPHDDSETDELISDGYDMESISGRYESQLKDIVREYTIMASLKGNTNIVDCDDLDYRPREGKPGWDIFIRMELLTPMTKAIDPDRAEEQAIQVGMDICTALVLCGRQHIVHRDIKPQNIFLSRQGQYKLGDFGVAKVASQTTAGTRTGTFRYMAPEVYNSKPYGTAADVYSLGMVLYWMLNGRRSPFVAQPPATPTARDEEMAQARRLQGEPLPPPREGSEELKRIVLKACAFDPKDRYSAGEMLRALQALAAERENGAPRAEPPARPGPDLNATVVMRGQDGPMGASRSDTPRQTPVNTPPQAAAAPPRQAQVNVPRQTPADTPPQAPKKTKKVRPILLAAVLAAAVGVGAFALQGRDRAPDSASSPEAAAAPTEMPAATPEPAGPAKPGEPGYAYVPPTALEDDPTSNVVEYFGDLYRIPAPLSAFESNGWTIADVYYDKRDDVDAEVTMERDGGAIHLYARDLAGAGDAYDGWFVTELSSYEGADLDPGLVLSPNIRIGMTRAELLQALEGTDYGPGIGGDMSEKHPDMSVKELIENNYVDSYGIRDGKSAIIFLDNEDQAQDSDQVEDIRVYYESGESSLDELFQSAHNGEPQPEGAVQDTAGVLSQETVDLVAWYNAMLESDCQGAQLVVVTADRFTQAVSPYAYGFFQNWDIGSRAEGNGLLLLAETEGPMGRLFCGDAFDFGIISDEEAREYMDQYFFPAWEEGRYDEAVHALAAQLYDACMAYYSADKTAKPVDIFWMDRSLAVTYACAKTPTGLQVNYDSSGGRDWHRLVQGYDFSLSGSTLTLLPAMINTAGYEWRAGGYYLNVVYRDGTSEELFLRIKGSAPPAAASPAP